MFTSITPNHNHREWVLSMSEVQFGVCLTEDWFIVYRQCQSKWICSALETLQMAQSWCLSRAPTEKGTVRTCCLLDTAVAFAQDFVKCTQLQQNTCLSTWNRLQYVYMKVVLIILIHFIVRLGFAYESVRIIKESLASVFLFIIISIIIIIIIFAFYLHFQQAHSTLELCTVLFINLSL